MSKDDENPKHLPKHFGFTPFRFVVAAILLLAAGLKAYQLATVPLPPVVQGSVFTPLLELLNDRYLLMAVVLGEILFALILIAGLWKQWTWLLSVLAFIVFTLISLMKGLSGESSCGCFGTVTVNPWITTCFDLTVVILLSIFRERMGWTFPKLNKKRVSAVLIVWLALAGSALIAMLSFDTESLTDIHHEIPAGKSITLEPNNWLGKQFPLDDMLDTPVLPEHWGQGKWIVLLHHRGCAICEELLQDLAMRADSFSLNRWAIVEIPDGVPAELSTPLREQAGLVCSLRRANTWFAPSPVVLTIENGIVTDVKIGILARKMFF